MSGEYTTEDMVRDFLNPAEYLKASELSAKGNLTVKSVEYAPAHGEYGEGYTVNFDDENGNAFVSVIGAKQPFTVFDTYKDKLIESVVRFEKLKTKDGKPMVKMRLVRAGEALTE